MIGLSTTWRAGGHFRIVTSYGHMPNVTLLFEIQHLAALKFTEVTHSTLTLFNCYLFIC